MRCTLFLLVCCSILPSPGHGQGTAPKESETVGGKTRPSSYMVQVSEYRLNSALDPAMSEKEILAMLNSKENDSIHLAETVRLSVLEGTEAHVQFGRRTTVTAGKMARGPGLETRVTQSLEVGTIVQVELEAEGDQVFVHIVYESSRLDGEGTDITPPDVVTTDLQSNHQVDLGAAKLIGGSSAANSTLLLMTVTR